MVKAPESVVTAIQAIDLGAFTPALSDAVANALYDIAVTKIERDEGSTKLRIHYCFPDPNVDSPPPQTEWLREVVTIDVWQQHEWEEQEEGRNTLSWKGGQLDPECAFVEMTAEAMEDFRANLPPPEEREPPSVPEATDPEGAQAASVDLDALLAKLRDDVADVFDATVRVTGIERVQVPELRISLELDPTQDGEWGTDHVVIPWRGEERFRHDAIEVISARLLD